MSWITISSASKRNKSDIIVLSDDESESTKKKLKLSEVGGMDKTVLQEQLLREEIKLKKMKELAEQPAAKETLPETSMFSGENVSNAISNLTAQVQQSMQPGPISPSVATTTAGINISARLQQMLDATALSNMTSKHISHGAEMSAIAYHLSTRKVAKKSLDKKLFSTPYPKTYRQVWPIVPVSDGDFIKNFGLEAVCHYFDSKWQMDHLVKQRNASASSKPICHQCKCDFASAWQVRKSNSHSLLLCESCDFKNLKTLQREKIANHLKDLANIISQDASDSAQPRGTNGSVDDVADGLKLRFPQRVNSKVSKYRVDPRPSDTILQQTTRQPKQPKLPGQASQGASSAEVESQLPTDSVKPQKGKKSEEKKNKSSLKDKLDLISKQLLEKRLQESKVCTSSLLEATVSATTDCETLSNSTDADLSNSPSRVRHRKQITPKAKRKASTNDNSIDTCND